MGNCSQAVAAKRMKMIKDMPEHNHPREKLRERGPCASTDMEAKIRAELAEVCGER